MSTKVDRRKRILGTKPPVVQSSAGEVIREEPAVVVDKDGVSVVDPPKEYRVPVLRRRG